MPAPRIPGLTGLSAAADLGLGGMLQQQQVDETEEQRRKRLMGASPLTQQSPAVMQLFGLTGVSRSGYGA